MSPRDLALEALGYIPNGNTATIAAASSLQLARIARDITAALQFIYSSAPAIYKQRPGALIAAPLRNVSVSVTNGSTALTCGTALVDGSTILIDGDPTMFNEVRIQASSKFLRTPFNGITGTYNATIWGDSILLGATVDRVIGTVMLNETIELEKRNNRNDAVTRIAPDPTDYGRRPRALPNKHVEGVPAAYWVEPVYYTDGTAALSRSYLRMKIYPLPNNAYSLGYDVRVKPPRLAVADLGTDGADSTTPLPIAADMIEAILLPIFLKRWSSSPWFRDKDQKASIAEQAKEAVALLAQYRPQQPSNRRITPGF